MPFAIRQKLGRKEGFYHSMTLSSYKSPIKFDK